MDVEEEERKMKRSLKKAVRRIKENLERLVGGYIVTTKPRGKLIGVEDEGAFAVCDALVLAHELRYADSCESSYEAAWAAISAAEDETLSRAETQRVLR